MDTKQLEELGLNLNDPDFEEQAMAIAHKRIEDENFTQMVRNSEEPTVNVEQTRSMSSMQFER